MQKATKILALIGFIFNILMIALFVILGIVMIVGGATTGDGDAVAAGIGTGIAFFIVACFFVPGLIFAKKISKENEAATPCKGKMILFGVLECIFGFAPAGILSIVRGCVQGK